MLTLAELQAEIERRAAFLGARHGLLPTFGASRDFGYPHIEIDGRGYHYVVVERGEELKRVTTTSLDEILYLVFEAVAFSMAMEYEVARRKPREDCRRQIFARQAELLKRMDALWAGRCRREQERVLAANPYRDGR